MNDAPPGSPSGYAGISQLYLQAVQNIAQAINGIAVTLAAGLRGAPFSVRGNPTSATATLVDIPAVADDTFLRRMAGALSWGVLTAAMVPANLLGLGKLAQGVARSVVGVAGNAAADHADIQGTADQVLRVNAAGTALAFGTIATGGIADASVSYAKLQNEGATSLLGNPTGAPAAPSEVTLAAALAFAGSTLDVAAHGISNAKFRQGIARSVVGVTGNATADVADIQGAADQVLVVNGAGTVLAFGQVAAGGIASNAVTTAKIIDDAVTYAKMQNVSATSRVLGRVTAGAGDTEELTLSQVLDFVGSAANGDILYRSGGSWTRLPIGSNTNVLTVASSLPSWAALPASGLTLLTSGTVSSAATLDLVLTSYTAYRGLVFALSGFKPATDNVALHMRFSTNGGSTYDASAGNYGFGAGGVFAGTTDGFGSNSDDHISIFDSASGATWVGVGNGAAEGVNATVTLLNQTSTAFDPRVTFQSVAVTADTSPFYISVSGGGVRIAAQDTDAVRFLFSGGGNIAAGNYAVYGLS
jgi:hypothetical protein